MLGSRRARLARTAHFLGNRQIDADGTILGLRMTIASARSRGPRGEQRFDFHRHTPLQIGFNRLEGYAASIQFAIRCRDGPPGWSCSIGCHG